MKHRSLSKSLQASLIISGMLLAASAFAQNPQGRHGMMEGHGTGWMGGYGGVWGPLLLVVVVAGAVAWVIAKKRK